MNKLGSRIIEGAREGLAHALGEDVPGMIVHPGTAGQRDWKAEAAEVDREYAEAKAALDVAFEAVRPGAPDAPARTILAEDLLTFGVVKERFEAIKARRKAFIQERVAHEAANP